MLKLSHNYLLTAEIKPVTSKRKRLPGTYKVKYIRIITNKLLTD